MPYVTHDHIRRFAEERINLRKDSVDRYRKQVQHLRETLAKKVSEQPDFALVKMLHSGSVAKGTALSLLNDMDVAVYVKQKDSPESDLLTWLRERLCEVYKGQKDPDHFTVAPGGHCVVVDFKGSGLDVDVVPVLYEDGAEDRGFLIQAGTGERVLTSIPLHLSFIRGLKSDFPQYAQIVRLLKWWAKHQKETRSGFRFKSFMVELLCAHLVRSGKLDLSSFPLAMEQFFAYLVRSRLRDRIAFSDFYSPSKLPSATGAAIEIFGPVNPENNIAASYTAADRGVMLDAAHDALDALTEAHTSDTKQRAVSCWKDVLGPSFSVSS